MHPNMATLGAYQDGELLLKRRQKVESHLSKCMRCRRECTQIQHAFDQFLTIEAQASNPSRASNEDLEQIFAGILRSKRATAPVTAAGAELTTRMVAKIDLYLGSGAASLVEDQMRGAPHKEGLLASVEPLLSAFLGRNAAASLTDQVLLQMAVERRLATELLA
jgi:anti-sigma factor RsiW